jgi:hypothetical protein
MSDDVMLPPQKFILPVAADTHEEPIGVDDFAFRVGFGDDKITLAHHHLPVCRDDLVFHASSIGHKVVTHCFISAIRRSPLVNSVTLCEF